MAVISDIIEGNTGKRTIRGWEFNRVFKVTELTASGDAMLVEATDATGVIFGDSHPTIASAYAVEFTPMSITNTGNAATVTILYREFSQNYEVDIASRNVVRPTYKAFPAPNEGIDSLTANTIEMKLDYTYPDDYKIESLQGTSESQTAELNVSQELDTLIITRTEFTTLPADAVAGWPLGTRLTGEILTDRSRYFNNRVNKAGWLVRPGDAEFTWKLRMSAKTAEDGLAFRVRYEFSYDDRKWTYPATFIDPQTGQAVSSPIFYDPPIVTEDYASRDYYQFIAADFDRLELY